MLFGFPGITVCCVVVGSETVDSMGEEFSAVDVSLEMISGESSEVVGLLVEGSPSPEHPTTAKAINTTP